MSDERATNTGYIYRVAHANADTLRRIAGQLVGLPCWTFGGASIWDMRPERGQANLRPMVKLTRPEQLADIDVSGDFGHAFSHDAEVRWRRIARDDYDVLILSEAPLSVDGASEIAIEWRVGEETELRWHRWQTRESGRLAVVHSGEGRLAIRYVTYHAPGGAAQFMRYTEVLS